MHPPSTFVVVAARAGCAMLRLATAATARHTRMLKVILESSWSLLKKISILPVD
jgi:hypothetical protein